MMTAMVVLVVTGAKRMMMMMVIMAVFMIMIMLMTRMVLILMLFLFLCQDCVLFCERTRLIACLRQPCLSYLHY